LKQKPSFKSCSLYLFLIPKERSKNKLDHYKNLFAPN
jgi:hypothetical protein